MAIVGSILYLEAFQESVPWLWRSAIMGVVISNSKSLENYKAFIWFPRPKLALRIYTTWDLRDHEVGSKLLKKSSTFFLFFFWRRMKKLFNFVILLIILWLFGGSVNERNTKPRDDNDCYICSCLIGSIVVPIGRILIMKYFWWNMTIIENCYDYDLLLVIL